MGMSGGDLGISGLASGLDIQSLVKKAMIPQQRQYDQLKAKEQKAEWTKDAYNSWYKKLSDFQNNTLFKYALSSGLMPKKTSSTDPSVVTATAGGGATCLSHQVTVNTLTSNAFLQTVGSIKRSNPKEPKSIKLSDIIGMSDVKLTAKTGETSPSDTLTFKIDDKEYTLKGDQMDQAAISFTLRDGSTVTNSDTGKTTVVYKKISFSYRDLAEGTLNDLANKITNAGLNLVAQYDSVNDSFSLYNTKGGAANTIDLTVDDIKPPAGTAASLYPDTTVQNTRTLLTNLDLGQYSSSNNSLGAAIDGSWFD